jgi:branched-chain amino acid transport system substrate-binding protein
MRRALLALAVLCASCASGSRPVVIGAVYPTAGGQGPGGIEEYRGVSLAADLTNSEGGVKGRPVRLRLERADSREAAPGAVERLAGAGAKVIVGSYGSTISATAAATAERTGLVFWETGAVGELGIQADSSGRVFRFPPSGAVLGRAAVDFVRDELADRVPAGSRWAVAYVDDVYGRSVGLGAAEQVRTSGLDLAATFPYQLPLSDPAALARDVAAARTDVLVVAAYLDDGVGLRRALVSERVPLKANIGTSSSYCMPEFGEQLGDDAVGVFASDKPDGDILTDSSLRQDAAAALRWGRDEYRRRFREPMSAAALSGFAGGRALFHHVLPRAASLSASDVTRAARAVELPAGSLPNGSGLRFGDHSADNRLASSVIWEWVKRGTREVVWPPSFATGVLM